MGKSTKPRTTLAKKRSILPANKIPKAITLSPSGNGRRSPKGQATKARAARKSGAVAVGRQARITSPDRPQSRYRDVAELSFGKRGRKPRRPAVRVAAIAASPDDRKRVPDPRQLPWRKICDLLITARDGTRHTGTAWFISPRTLVTAGHCIAVFRPGTPAHGIVNNILIMPARNGEVQPPNPPFGWIQVTPQSLQVHPRWANNGDLDFDYGAIILPPDAPLGATLGFFGYGHFSDQQLDEAPVTISGYPDDVIEGTQWFETNRIKEVTPARVSYDIFTFAGQSGSPVFFGNATKQIACAIHNFGDSPLNSGVRINGQVVAQLNAWRF